MEEPTENIAKWIQELTRRSAEEQMRSVQRYNEMIQRVARGELSDADVRDEYMRFAREESLRYARQLTTLSLRYYNDLVEVYRSYSDHFFRTIFGAANGEAAQEPSAPPEARRVEMSLHAPLGQVATGSFVLENKRPESAEISFLVSEFSESGGENTFRPPLHIQPPRFHIEPHQEMVVSLNLGLLPQLFQPGVIYRATVVVRGYDDLELVLKVWADPVEAAQAEAEPPVEAEIDEADLTQVVGVGPAYAKKLKEAGIATLSELSGAGDSALSAALGEAGLRRAERGMWREQADLIVRGEWEQLTVLRDSLENA